MRTSARAAFLAFALPLAIGLQAPLRAHDPGLSSAYVTVQASQLHIRVELHNGDVARALPTIDTNHDQWLDAAELADGKAELSAFGRRFTNAAECRVELGEDEDICFELRTGPPVAEFTYAPSHWSLMPRGHRQFVAFCDDGEIRTSRLLRAASPTVTFDLGRHGHQPTSNLLTEFLLLGVEHILIGFDHILFLLALLLAAPSLRTAATCITAFTAAHSLTLVAATLDWAAMPGTIVEPIIALSIVWVAFGNLRARRSGKTPRHRFAWTFGFGLVHGFGFASVLRDLGIAEHGGVAIPLVAFNFGVELGQLAIAAVALPLLARLCRRSAAAGPVGRPGRIQALLNIALIACGAFWLLERIGLLG